MNIVRWRLILSDDGCYWHFAIIIHIMLLPLLFHQVTCGTSCNDHGVEHGTPSAESNTLSFVASNADQVKDSLIQFWPFETEKIHRAVYPLRFNTPDGQFSGSIFKFDFVAETEKWGNRISYTGKRVASLHGLIYRIKSQINANKNIEYVVTADRADVVMKASAFRKCVHKHCNFWGCSRSENTGHRNLKAHEIQHIYNIERNLFDQRIAQYKH